jgi:hypothetical protein
LQRLRRRGSFLRRTSWLTETKVKKGNGAKKNDPFHQFGFARRWSLFSAVWVGIHNGNFDIVDLNKPASKGLERLAENENPAYFCRNNRRKKAKMKMTFRGAITSTIDPLHRARLEPFSSKWT